MKKTYTSETEKQIDQAQESLNAFESDVKELTLDRMNQAKREEVEPQTKLSQKEISNSKDIYLKPARTISCQEKFNEKFREDYNFAKEYVHFIAENYEIIGETIDTWTKKFPGQPAEYWNVPTNKPVWGPRYLAEQIKGCSYHRLTMQNNVTSADHTGQYFGTMVADTVVQRLDARPVSSKKSVFMGAGGF